MAIIDPSGLFNGKRLRRCSLMARLYWPYFYSLANGFGRIELDFEALSFSFASFGAEAPTSAAIEGYFDEYLTAHLLFVYQVDDQRWGQWDTRRSYLKDFKTAADKKSPNPPEPEYRRWLQEQHGEDWRAFHWSKEADGEPEDSIGATGVPHNSMKGSTRFAEQLGKSSANVPQDFSLGVGVGGGVGDGKGEGNSVGGGDGEFAPPLAIDHREDPTPENMPPTALAMHLLERLGVPRNPALLMAVSESIQLVSKADGTSLAAAHDFLLTKATLARQSGLEKPWRFWFEDEDYNLKTKKEARNEWLQRHSEDNA